MSVKVISKGLPEISDYLKRVPDIANQAAAFAINDTATGPGLKMLRDAIYDEIDFPRGYLDNDRLGVKSKATPSKLEAVIRGRDRPTSLARFAAGGQSPASTRKGGVTIQVKKTAKHLSGAWLVPLRSGNVGLAVRTRPGSNLRGSRGAVELFNDKSGTVYLLYGPSVDQVFGDVAAEHVDDIEKLIIPEFFRQFTRLSNG